MRKLTIITGEIASGKSTEARRMRGNRDKCVIIEEAHKNWNHVEHWLGYGYEVIAVMPGEYDIRHVRMD